MRADDTVKHLRSDLYMVDEADALIVAAGLAAFGAAEVRSQIDCHAGVIGAEMPTQLGHVDRTMLAAAGVAAMDAHSVTKRQHLADRVDANGYVISGSFSVTAPDPRARLERG